MRKAVNYAVDRTAYGDQAGPYAATPYDQYLPPGMPGYEDIQVYPDHPDIERRATWPTGIPETRDARSPSTTDRVERSTRPSTRSFART